MVKEKLREARRKFQKRNYPAAKNLASQALRENKEELNIPWIGLAGGLIGLIMILITARFGPAFVRSFIKSWKANREIRKIKGFIKSKKRDGDLENAQRTKQQIDNAEKALLEDRHEDAMEILKQIEQDLS